jgi:hypothetical protein
MNDFSARGEGDQKMSISPVGVDVRRDVKGIAADVNATLPPPCILCTENR